MSRAPHPHQQQAIDLRRQALSRSQICEALGLRSGGASLDRWLKDVPPPDWTKRPGAKDGLREQAIAMRKDGKSYREIREVIPVSKSSLSLWLKDVVLTDEQRERFKQLNHNGRTKAARTIQARRLARQAATIDAAKAQISAVAESELFVAGVVAYWAEGCKSKPWRPGEEVDFINSDPDLIRLFIRWLSLIGVDDDRLQFRISIHESADVQAAHRFWASVVGVAPEAFEKATIKRHNPKTVRKNVGEHYHGCLTVRVRRSTDLYRQIAGWWAGIIAQVAP
jgi:hypothetical protein